MKVLGVSFGRKGGNCDTVLKRALLGAQAAGAEVEYINTNKLYIDRCNGCGACDKVREKGGMSVCVHKDDFAWLEDHIMEADGLIFAAPVYSVGPVGQLKNVVDKMGASHDRAALIRENERRRALGWPEEKMIPAKYFKNRPVAYISIGGAETPGWTSLGLPVMHLLGVSNQMIPVDAIDAYGMGMRVNPAFDEDFWQRLYDTGYAVGEAVFKPAEKVTWKGRDEGYCPICHGRNITLREGTTVECSVCGCIGEMKIVDGQMKIDFPEEQLMRSRYKIGGLYEHNDEIAGMIEYAIGKMAKDGDKLPELLAPLDAIKEIKK